MKFGMKKKEIISRCIAGCTVKILVSLEVFYFPTIIHSMAKVLQRCSAYSTSATPRQSLGSDQVKPPFPDSK